MTESVFPEPDMALTHILVISDLEVSKEFYKEVLGAKIYGEYGGTSVVLDFNGNWLLIVTGAPPTKDKPATHFEAPQGIERVNHAFTIRVQDCKRSYDILKARGANFLTEPTDWGAEIRCFFADPDGHLFEISQLTGKR